MGEAMGEERGAQCLRTGGRADLPDHRHAAPPEVGQHLLDGGVYGRLVQIGTYDPVEQILRHAAREPGDRRIITHFAAGQATEGKVIACEVIIHRLENGGGREIVVYGNHTSA
jgi:hypothetical protein